MAAIGYRVRRREPVEGPMLTPAEYTGRRATQPGEPFVSERMRQSEVHSRPSKRIIQTWFLSPMGDWSSEDFLFGEVPIPRPTNFPRGRLSQMDDRMNVAVPPRISYGSMVGEMDGVSPNGLD
jgi:hypothetical protein